MRQFTETEIDDMVAEHERRRRARDEALLDEQDDAGPNVDQMLAEAAEREEDAFFERWAEMDHRDKLDYMESTCPGFDPLALVYDTDEAAHYRTCTDRDREGCCRCSACEGCCRCLRCTGCCLCVGCVRCEGCCWCMGCEGCGQCLGDAGGEPCHSNAEHGCELDLSYDEVMRMVRGLPGRA